MARGDGRSTPTQRSAFSPRWPCRRWQAFLKRGQAGAGEGPPAPEGRHGGRHSSACAAFPPPMQRDRQGVSGHRMSAAAIDLTEAGTRPHPGEDGAVLVRRRSRHADGRRELVGLDAGGDRRRAGRDRRGAVSRQAALALDLSPGGDGIRGDVERSRGRCRQKLAERFVIGRPECGRPCRPAWTATRKFLFRFRDGQEAETVYIPDRHAGSRCGVHLVAGGLHAVVPVLPHRHPARWCAIWGPPRSWANSWRRATAYGEWPSPHGETPRLLSTIVLMGMGEPLYNYENVAKRDAHRDGRRGHRPVAPANHPVHFRRGADDGSLRGRAGREPRGVAACGARRRCATRSCR